MKIATKIGALAKAIADSEHSRKGFDFLGDYLLPKGKRAFRLLATINIVSVLAFVYLLLEGGSEQEMEGLQVIVEELKPALGFTGICLFGVAGVVLVSSFVLIPITSASISLLRRAYTACASYIKSIRLPAFRRESVPKEV